MGPSKIVNAVGSTASPGSSVAAELQTSNACLRSATILLLIFHDPADLFIILLLAQMELLDTDSDAEYDEENQKLTQFDDEVGGTRGGPTQGDGGAQPARRHSAWNHLTAPHPC